MKRFLLNQSCRGIFVLFDIAYICIRDMIYLNMIKNGVKSKMILQLYMPQKRISAMHIFEKCRWIYWELCSCQNNNTSLAPNGKIPQPPTEELLGYGLSVSEEWVGACTIEGQYRSKTSVRSGTGMRQLRAVGMPQNCQTAKWTMFDVHTLPCRLR